MPSLFDAALVMLDRGWLAIPLGPDSEGRPKRPLTLNWPNLTRSRSTLESLPWKDAKGLGIVLGATSSNLAAIDLDDIPLTNAVWRALSKENTQEPFSYEPPPRMVRTIRGRGHLYVQEKTPSRSRRYQVKFFGQAVTVELKTTGNQVAAPPTPGYILLVNGPLYPCNTIQEAWDDLCVLVEANYEGALVVPEDGPDGAHAGYPQPWQEVVPLHERNQTLYIEAHRLREARMPLEQALGLLLARVGQNYTPGGFSREEAEATIRSAYAKGLPPSTEIGTGNDESGLLSF